MENKGRDLVKPENLGEGPESRMQNFPKKKAQKNDALIGGNPGEPKPASADASGEGDADELAENMDDATVRLREEDAQRDSPDVEHKNTAPDPRRRAKESPSN
jgi:hypothetical protein